MLIRDSRGVWTAPEQCTGPEKKKRAPETEPFPWDSSRSSSGDQTSSEVYSLEDWAVMFLVMRLLLAFTGGKDGAPFSNDPTNESHQSQRYSKPPLLTGTEVVRGVLLFRIFSGLQAPIEASFGQKLIGRANNVLPNQPSAVCYKISPSQPSSSRRSRPKSRGCFLTQSKNEFL